MKHNVIIVVLSTQFSGKLGELHLQLL